MRIQLLRRRALAFVAGVAVLACSGWASADPPSRVARLGYTIGAVSFSPAGEDDWMDASINRPLTTGDRLWTEARARAEIQLGGALIHVDDATGISVLNLDDRIAQLELTQGVLNVRVRYLEPGQLFEVDTPNLAFTLEQPGEFRIEVDPQGDATTIMVRDGRGEVYGEDAAYSIDSRQAYRFTGTGLREYRYVAASRLDDFDHWSGERNRRYDDSPSARYVSRDVVGYQDLDANGSWRVDPTYGNVWFPHRVAAGWAPYRDGHWAWVDPWGWTWVDDAPWGFAVSHYGRWANLHGTWGWVPGPVRSRAYYAPALVVFVGGANFQISISSGNVGGVAWFPLGPREVYRPSYQVSRRYFQNINHSNTVINNTVVNNYYDNRNVTRAEYANRRVPGAVVAVPRTAFERSQPVSRAAVRVREETIVHRPTATAPAVAPTEKSVRGTAGQRDKPPARVFGRPVVARTQPPAARAGFAAQRQHLNARPGRPLDDAARKGLKPAAAAPAPVVKLVPQTKEAPPTKRPPVAAPKPQPEQAQPTPKPAPRARGEQRTRPVAPAQRRAEPKGRPAPKVAPAAPAAKRAEPPKAEPRGRGEQRAQPVTPPQRAAQPKVAPAPKAVPPAPAAKRAEPGPPAVEPKPQRSRPEPAQKAGSRDRKAKPAAGTPDEKKKDREEQKREEERLKRQQE